MDKLIIDSEEDLLRWIKWMADQALEYQHLKEGLQKLESQLLEKSD